MELKKKLGKRIQELRLKNNWKQAELAEKVGIANKTQSCIETGRNFPSSELIEKYAKAFNVKLSDLLNISHIEDTSVLLKEIQNILNNANDEEIKLIYKIVKSIVN